MRVTVHYLAQIKRAVGCAVEEFHAPEPATLRELLALVADRHGPGLRPLLLDEQARPVKSLLFFIGDEHADPCRPLHDGDTVTILAPMAGG
jgi:molybdopterin converting factor small subunit